jgi:general secretion pathway protein D
MKLQDSDSNVLASPRIRAKNKEKAKILIGDKVPTFVETQTANGSGAPLRTFSPSYQDIGLKLEIEPQIYSDSEVGIKVNLEVSNISGYVSSGGVNGTSAPIVGTRSATTSLRLRDGETQVLAGLIRDEERNTATKIPGVGHLPIVGRIFGNNDSNGRKQELILSITPRIIRAPTIADIDVSNVYSGSESLIREKPLRLDPIGAVRGTTTGSTGATGGAPRIDGTGASEAGAALGGAGARGAAGAGGATSPSTNAVNIGTGTGADGNNTTTNPGTATPVAPRTPTPGSTTPGTRILPPSTRPGGIFRPATPPSAPGESAPPPDPNADSSALPQGAAVASAAGKTAVGAAASTDTAAAIAAANTAAEAGGAATAATAQAAVPPTAKPVDAATTAGTPSAPSDASFAWTGPNSVQVGKQLQVTLTAGNMLNLHRLPLVLRYDGLVLSYQSFQLGELALAAGGSVDAPKANAAIGRLDIPISFSKPELLKGDGAIITLTFTAKTARASTSLVATQVDVKGADGQLRTIARPQNYIVRTVN